MPTFPPSSPGVLIAPFAGGLIAYDLVEGIRHSLVPPASLVLAACDAGLDRVEAIPAWAAEAGAEQSAVAEMVDAAVHRIAQLGIVGRTVAWEPPPQLAGAPVEPPADGVHLSAPHPALDLEIRFRGADRGLLDLIDSYLGTAVGTPADRTGGEPIIFDVEGLDDGTFRLVADEVALHDDLGTLLGRLVKVSTDHACATGGCAALHAAGVRGADGSVTVFPGASESGKSTLAGALVAAGWDYLGDEAIGVDPEGRAFGFPKRLRLGPTSCSVLGVDHPPRGHLPATDLRPDVVSIGGPSDPITRVVFPTYVPGADPAVERLEPDAALDSLIGNTLNLDRAGRRGLEALCHLAETVEAHSLVHGDATAAADHLTAVFA